MKTIYTLSFILAFHSLSLAQVQMNKATEIMISSLCDGNLSNNDTEQAVFQYDQTNNQFVMMTDMYEITYEGLENDPSKFETEEDGIPLMLITKLEIPDLEFKTSADNGDTFQFNCEVSCNNKILTIPVTFTFFYAPIVAESNMDGAPIHSFRLDFSFTFKPSDLDLALSHNCNQIVVKVQDTMLNTTER